MISRGATVRFALCDDPSAPEMCTVCTPPVSAGTTIVAATRPFGRTTGAASCVPTSSIVIDASSPGVRPLAATYTVRPGAARAGNSTGDPGAGFGGAVTREDVTVKDLKTVARDDVATRRCAPTLASIGT